MTKVKYDVRVQKERRGFTICVERATMFNKIIYKTSESCFPVPKVVANDLVIKLMEAITA